MLKGTIELKYMRVQKDLTYFYQKRPDRLWILKVATSYVLWCYVRFNITSWTKLLDVLQHCKKCTFVCNMNSLNFDFVCFLAMHFCRKRPTFNLWEEEKCIYNLILGSIILHPHSVDTSWKIIPLFTLNNPVFLAFYYI